MASINAEKLKTRFFTALVVAPPCLFLAYYGSWPFMVLVGVCFVIAMMEWFSMSRKLGMRLYFPLGALYLTICCYSFLLVGLERNVDALLLIILIASSDIGAYFSGKIIGGPKMAEKISPNKTMAGLGGAIFAPALVLLGFEFFVGRDSAALVLFLLFGGLIGLAGQAGDILVSLMKRKAQVKDTGDILPGHGGLLDRIDSLLLAAPVFIILEYLIDHI